MTRRSLWPREHGAYVQLAVPLAAACLRTTPTPSALALIAASVLAFLAHEPMLVAMGNRGARRRAEDGRRASRRALVLAALAGACGIAGLAAADPSAIYLAAIVAIPSAAVVALARSRRVHTAAGEVLASVALTGACAPVLAASGVGFEDALVTWLAWAAASAASVIAVRRVIARHKRRATGIDVVVAIGLAAALAGCIAAGSTWWLAAAPIALAEIIVVVPPRATYLRAIGITFAVTLAASACLVVA